MKHYTTMALGLLGLCCGMFLLLESAKQLRADPVGGEDPFGVCPHKDLSEATKDCAKTYECSNDHNSETKCLTPNTHFVSITFPLECIKDLPATQDKLCNVQYRDCTVYWDCEYDRNLKKCNYGAVTNIGQEEKFIAGTCPPKGGQ